MDNNDQTIRCDCCFASLKRKDMKKHKEEECEENSIVCECGLLVKSKDSNKHKEECRLSKVPCSFSRWGCEGSLRVAKPHHNAAFLHKHMELVSKRLGEKDNVEKLSREEINELAFLCGKMLHNNLKRIPKDLCVVCFAREGDTVECKLCRRFMHEVCDKDNMAKGRCNECRELMEEGEEENKGNGVIDLAGEEEEENEDMVDREAQEEDGFHVAEDVDREEDDEEEEGPNEYQEDSFVAKDDDSEDVLFKPEKKRLEEEEEEEEEIVKSGKKRESSPKSQDPASTPNSVSENPNSVSSTPNSSAAETPQSSAKKRPREEKKKRRHKKKHKREKKDD